MVLRDGHMSDTASEAAAPASLSALSVVPANAWRLVRGLALALALPAARCPLHAAGTRSSRQCYLYRSAVALAAMRNACVCKLGHERNRNRSMKQRAFVRVRGRWLPSCAQARGSAAPCSLLGAFVFRGWC